MSCPPVWSRTGLALLLIGLLSARQPPARAAADLPGAAGAVTVAGNRLLRDGRPFVPQGFTVLGALTPAWCDNRTGAQAALHLDRTELAAARRWHADTVRLQVSYNGLTTHAAADRAAYLTRVEAAVGLALDAGLAVIVSLQDQAIGCGPSRPLPPRGAEQAWQLLATALMNEPAVLFELWNEPDNNASPERVRQGSPGYDSTLAWPDWLSGRRSAITPDPHEPWQHFAPYVPTGHQDLLAAVRRTGARNVVIADGGYKAEVLTRLPLLTDSLVPEQVAYATHPYGFTAGRASWDVRFGALAATRPVLATEWDIDCLLPGDYRSAARYRAAVRAQTSLSRAFLSYLRDRHIGLTAWAFDLPGTLVTDWSYAPTTQTGCSYRAGGALVQAYFRTTP